MTLILTSPIPENSASAFSASRSALPPREFPSALEIFLVPGHIAYVAVHTPVRSAEGYPVPLGILSFDPDVVARAQASLVKIFATSFAVPYHCDWGAKDVVASVRAALQPDSTSSIQTS